MSKTMRTTTKRLGQALIGMPVSNIRGRVVFGRFTIIWDGKPGDSVEEFGWVSDPNYGKPSPLK